MVFLSQPEQELGPASYLFSHFLIQHCNWICPHGCSWLELTGVYFRLFIFGLVSRDTFQTFTAVTQTPDESTRSSAHVRFKSFLDCLLCSFATCGVGFMHFLLNKVSFTSVSRTCCNCFCGISALRVYERKYIATQAAS